MKNNGFTLIELLATIVIIAIVGAIAVVNLNGFLTSTQEKVYKTYENSMKTAIIEYIVESGEPPTSSTPICVKLSKLVNPDTVNHIPAYLDKFTNPSGNDTCEEKSFIFVEVDNDNEHRDKTDDKGYTDNNRKYVYRICLSCDNYKSEDCSKVTASQKTNICHVTE